MVRQKRKQQQQQNKKQSTKIVARNRSAEDDSLFADPELKCGPGLKKQSKVDRMSSSSLDLCGSSTRSRLLAAAATDSGSCPQLIHKCSHDDSSRNPLVTRPDCEIRSKQPPKQKKKLAEPEPANYKILDFSSIEKYSLLVESVQAESQSPVPDVASAASSATVAQKTVFRPTLHFSTPLQQLQREQRRRLNQEADAHDSTRSSIRRKSLLHQQPVLSVSAVSNVEVASPAPVVAFRDHVSRAFSDPVRKTSAGSFYARAKKRASSRRCVELDFQRRDSASSSDIDADSRDDEAEDEALLSLSAMPLASNADASSSAETSLNATYWSLYWAGQHKDCVLRICNQTGPLAWRQFLPEQGAADTAGDSEAVKKLGEGVFGEVYSVIGEDGSNRLAVKVLPIAGRRKVNDEPQKSFAEVLPELLIARKLTALSRRYRANRTPGFVQLLSASVHRGRLHPRLADAWRRFAAAGVTENDCPADLPASQLWLAMRLAFAGGPLETYSLSDGGPAQALSIAAQVAASLAAAESELQFEHRDLHWGNVLIQAANSPSIAYLVAGQPVTIATNGAAATVIDFTISRLSPRSGCVMYTDLSEDKDLFAGQGDYQFEIYRLMRTACSDQWRQFAPRTNILWLHYLAVKLLDKLKPDFAAKQLSEVQQLVDHVLTFKSCQELVICSDVSTKDLFASVKCSQ